MSSKNATYISPEYISKYINIMDEFVKKPLHSTMKGNKFDETPDITSLEQLDIPLRNARFACMDSTNVNFSLLDRM